MKLAEQWDLFISSFKQKRILNVILYELLLFLAVFVIVVVLQAFMVNLSEKAQGLIPIGPDTQLISPADQANFVEAMKIQTGYVASVTLAIVLVALAFITTRFMIYNKLTKHENKKGFYGKNILVTLLTSIIAFVLAYLLQSLLFIMFYTTMHLKPAQYAMLVLATIFMTSILYLLINFKLRFFKEQAFLKGLKSFFDDNIKGIKNYLLPMLYAIAVFILLNILMAPFLFSPQIIIFGIIFTILLVFYFAWLKVYYLMLMEKTHKKKPKRTKGNS